MSTIDLAIQRVTGLDEQLASKLLVWLDSQQVAKSGPPKERPLGALAMIAFAVHGARTPRATNDWIQELREGEAD